MEKRTLGNALEVSALGFGCVGLSDGPGDERLKWMEQVCNERYSEMPVPGLDFNHD